MEERMDLDPCNRVIYNIEYYDGLVKILINQGDMWILALLAAWSPESGERFFVLKEVSESEGRALSVKLLDGEFDWGDLCDSLVKAWVSSDAKEYLLRDVNDFQQDFLKCVGIKSDLINIFDLIDISKIAGIGKANILFGGR